MKTAIILLNLGGPDDLSSVRPFLTNLFDDPAIIRLPVFFRWPLARFIAWTRLKKARGIYRSIGGKSPLLEQTQAQAEALEKTLKGKGDYKTFVSMRYWHPMSRLVAKNVKRYAPEHVILLPLYPQFSTTTTGSSYDDWRASAKQAGLTAPTTLICCYPIVPSFIVAHAKLIRDAYWRASEHGKPRVLFSAHGLPEKIVQDGDPYQWQTEKTVATIVQMMAIDALDHAICYQSRVGRMKWIGPSTDEELARAGKDGLPVVIVPISFVSEHSETLAELDIYYREIAGRLAIPNYQRVPALASEQLFIEALAELCQKSKPDEAVCSFDKLRYCPRNFTGCPCGIPDAD